MAKKKRTRQPSEMPLPSNPEITPGYVPDEPELPIKPEIIPDDDPVDPETPPEFPQTK